MIRFAAHATALSGVKLLERRSLGDARGSFFRLFCDSELADVGWGEPVRQINVSRTSRRGTVRGLHYQVPPHAENKIVTCLRGAICDVAVDLRADSPTFLRYVAVTLSGENLCSLLIPKGCAHGFQSLTDEVEMIYLHSEPWQASADTGVDPLDPTLSVPWPLPVEMISEKDRGLPRIGPTLAGLRK